MAGEDSSLRPPALGDPNPLSVRRAVPAGEAVSAAQETVEAIAGFEELFAIPDLTVAERVGSVAAETINALARVPGIGPGRAEEIAVAALRAAEEVEPVRQSCASERRSRA
jgi:hypothetical protein